MKVLKRSWTQEEDTALLALIKRIGVGKWQVITNLLEIEYKIMGRTGKQCRERWLNHLNPEVNKGPWTQEEEEQLFMLRKAFGHKWKLIAQNMPGRSDNEVKNHFYKKVRKNLRHYNKTHEIQIKGNLETILLNPEYEAMLVTAPKQLVVVEEARERTCLPSFAEYEDQGSTDWETDTTCEERFVTGNMISPMDMISPSMMLSSSFSDVMTKLRQN